VGAKLRPEWTKALLGGEVLYKPRPWLPARMPSFTNRAASLAQGMAAQHGYPPLTAPEPPIDEAAAKVGQRLVSADGGFACIACHAVGQVKATQVFESAGINLAYAEERLRPYYERWLRNPQETILNQMPVYFDEECKSPLIDYYEAIAPTDRGDQAFQLRENAPPVGAELGP
jgi:mono/diheme cytochrome c family protein